ncbi:MAG: hypothetical protein DRI84_03255 [Bacteroidetes bacterium]|nr:MAG: hypothetical protein DRI84_03255 [Bacteroidota bacterium]
MTLKKDFLSYKVSDLKICRSDLIIGLLIGLIFSFGFYSIIYTFRESLRVWSMLHSFNYWIITDDDLFFYNLFTAYWAFIFGQSFSFNYWMTKPILGKGRMKIQRISILNDQRNLNWFAVSALSKIGWVVGFFFIFAFTGAHELLGFSKDYRFVFYLFIIVLFLNSWITIRKVFKRHSFKWMLVSALLISVLSFSVASLNIIVYKDVNGRYMNNPILNIELPSSKYFDRVEDLSLVQYVYISSSKDSLSKELSIFINRKAIKFSALFSTLDSLIDYIPEYKVKRSKVVLLIDKKTEIHEVKKLRLKIGSLSRYYRLFCGVTPEYSKLNKRYFLSNPGIVYLPPFADARETVNGVPPPPSPNIHHYENIIRLKLLRSGQINVNGKIVKNKNLEKHLKEKVVSNMDYIFYMQVDTMAIFDQYIGLINAVQGSIYRIRDDEVNKRWNMDFSKLDYDLQNEIRRQIPLRFVEFYHED